MPIHKRVPGPGANQRDEKGRKFLLGQKLLSELLSAPCEESPARSRDPPNEDQNTARWDQIVQDVLDVRETRRNTIRSNIIANFFVKTSLVYLISLFFL